MSTGNDRDRGKERFWRRVVREWRRSGWSVRDFCAERGLSEPSFYAWRRTLAQRDAEAARFVPVRIVTESTPARHQVDPVGPDAKRASAGHGAGCGLELVVGAGRVLRIGPGFDAATLRRLLALLEEGRP